MTLRLHFLGWLCLCGSLIAAIYFVVGGTQSFRRATTQGKERTFASQIATDVNLLSAIEWQSRTELRVSRANLLVVSQTHLRIESAFRKLGTLKVTDGDDTVVAKYHRYARAVDRELELIQGRDTAAAQSFDRRVVDPSYEELGHAIDRQTPILLRDSERPIAQARRRFLDAIVAVGFLVALLIWQFVVQQRGRRGDRALLRRSEELARQKDEFIATVSHELRTPLTSIRGYTELLDHDASLGAEQNQWVDVIGRNAARLHSIVADLLLVAEVSAGKFVLDLGDVDLADVLADAVEAARPAAVAKGLTLTSEADLHVWVPGDRARLSQVVDNLVSNAIKFTPAGGSVVVRVTRRGANAVLEVADSGVGIAPADQDQLFERFFRTDDATKAAIQGTGLGLAISRSLVAAHFGTISVTSKLGAGATFRVELPISEARPLSLAS